VLINSARAVKAAPLDDDAFRLLAIPFGGPIPSPIHKRGVDVDGETFTERTAIYPDWLKERPTDWHHGGDGVMQRTVLGKAVDIGRFDGKADEPDEDGWWVTVWLKHGENRLNLIRRLAERGAQIFGSSETIASLSKKSQTGEILAWPYIRQTLSTSPQNTLSVLRPLKASLDELISDGYMPTSSLWSDLIEGAVRDLGTDLRATSLFGGERVAKAQASEAEAFRMIRRLDEAITRLAAVAAPTQENK